ncbi:MAG: UDP-N-acetylmuramoyl-tripeptide--D-alanyl-D-alanine ligase [Candidatus Colwellbacteria bacterium]|nr:UDP-N-acetylmuramoyl-tripeptide--D-alanyl-D-alanine ligase [Candidatus Colwellbacteria bacterium]
MKKTILSVLSSILRWISRATISKYHPKIIGVTGSVGKSSAKEAIYAVLKDSMKVRASRGNFNNELGFPLAILGDYDHLGGGLFWIDVVCRGLWNLLFGRDYPEVLILEYGADKPGDIGYLTSIAKPDIAVIASISKTPVHLEYYKNPEAVAREKGRLVEASPKTGAVILNADDELVIRMVEKAKGKTLTYGFDGADVRIVGFLNVSDEGRPVGISFKLETLGKLLPIRIDGCFGRAQAYASAAALAVAEVMGVNLLRAAEKLSEYRPLPGRTRLIKGIVGSWIIDDTYNASPLAMTEVLKALKELTARRKIAILGDMKELGGLSDYAHIEAGKLTALSADVLLAVGEKGKIIARAALDAGMSKDSVRHFDDSDSAKIFAKDIVMEGDLILIKGSQSMRMEKVTAALMAEPDRAGELLVRQYGKWLK